MSTHPSRSSATRASAKPASWNAAQTSSACATSTPESASAPPGLARRAIAGASARSGPARMFATTRSHAPSYSCSGSDGVLGAAASRYGPLSLSNAMATSWPAVDSAGRKKSNAAPTSFAAALSNAPRWRRVDLDPDRAPRGRAARGDAEHARARAVVAHEPARAAAAAAATRSTWPSSGARPCRTRAALEHERALRARALGVAARGRVLAVPRELDAHGAEPDRAPQALRARPSRARRPRRARSRAARRAAPRTCSRSPPRPSRCSSPRATSLVSVAAVHSCGRRPSQSSSAVGPSTAVTAARPAAASTRRRHRLSEDRLLARRVVAVAVRDRDRERADLGRRGTRSARPGRGRPPRRRTRSRARPCPRPTRTARARAAAERRRGRERDGMAEQDGEQARSHHRPPDTRSESSCSSNSTGRDSDPHDG